MIRVLLADDQILVRAGFRVLLETEDGFEVCGEAGDGEQAVAGAIEHTPDIPVSTASKPPAGSPRTPTSPGQKCWS
jgi:DNA-binding NarL/FixJ family response regulator